MTDKKRQNARIKEENGKGDGRGKKQRGREKVKQAETIKKVLQYLGKYRIFLIFSILLAALSVALTLYIPKLTGQAVDYIV